MLKSMTIKWNDYQKRGPESYISLNDGQKITWKWSPVFENVCWGNYVKMRQIPKKLWVFELWVLECIGGHNFLCRNMYLHLIVIIGVDNNNCNLQLLPKPIIPWERWLVCHQKLLNLLFQGTMCLGGHWRSQFLLLAQITTMKCLSRSFCQENCAICHIFFTLPFRGHWGQTLFPYDLHHDAMIQKAGS